MKTTVEFDVKIYLTGLAALLKDVSHGGGDIQSRLAALSREIGIVANSIREDD